MLVNIDLMCVYNVIPGTKIYLGYETSLDGKEQRTIKYSSRRKKDIFVKPGSDVKLIIYNRRQNIYFIEDVAFNDGVGSVEDILIKNNIKYEHVSKQRWDDWKKSAWVQSHVQPSDKGYYTWTHLWMDIDVWLVNMVSKDGIDIPGVGTIKEIHYKKVGGEISKDIYKTMDKMINENISAEEYEKFKGMCTNVPALDIKFKEVLV